MSLARLNLEDTHVDRIVSMYEELGLDTATIAVQFEKDEADIIYILRKNSEKFQADESNGKAYFKPDDLQALLTEYKNLALSSEEDSIREKALRFLIEEASGRNERRIAKHEAKETNNTFNILQINETLKKAREVLGEETLIEVEEEHG